MIPIILELIRAEENIKYGTFGYLKINKQVFCVTLEPPDRENKSNISSIPTGQYICKRYTSKRYPDTFQIMDVTDRTKILFHAGNTDEDTAGCIILAQYWGKLNDEERAVLNSGNTFRHFMKLMGDNQYLHLTIKEDY